MNKKKEQKENKIYSFLMRHLPIDKVERLSKRIYLSAKDDVSLYDGVKHLKLELERNDIMAHSKSVAFNFTLALFPGIIFLFTLIPYIPIENLDVYILNLLESNMPPVMFEEARTTIEDIIADVVVTQRSGLLSFGFIMALTMATNGMESLISSFNSCNRSIEKRSFFKRRLVSTSLTALLALVLLGAVVILIFGNMILNLLVQFHVIKLFELQLVSVLNYLVFAFIFFMAISLIYYFGPAVKKRWKFISYGTLVAIILCILVSSAFSYYLGNFSNYNKLYGSIGTLIGIMIWLQAISYILLFGFEINTAIDEAKEEIKNIRIE